MSDFKKKYLKGCLIAAGVIIVLILAFTLSDGEPKKVSSPSPTPEVTAEPDNEIVFSETHELAEPSAQANTPEPTAEPSPTPNTITVNETMELENPKEDVCTISVSCKDLDRGKLPAEKQKIIPEDGIILSETTVQIKEGETVYDVLLRLLTEKKIHFTAKNTPGLGKYVSGIGNLFEGDTGENTGWGFKVNGEFPTVSATSLKVNPGDVIEWIYFQ